MPRLVDSRDVYVYNNSIDRPDARTLTTGADPNSHATGAATYRRGGAAGNGRRRPLTGDGRCLTAGPPQTALL
ncbi:MAG: hypothetical protein BWY85_01422 [Firmicutes bacterium ADurb.Bin506]|nr:MAG: hypothetical protein BWY85_01422 [Firmicutes bacterium ADurb.Bin506]